MSVTFNLYYHCIMILGSREEQNFENFLKENYVRIGDGKCQCTICNKVTTHAGNSLNAHISCMHNKRTV